jgi:hypothetical protein
MEFSIVMFTSSGLLVRYLKVIEKSGYTYILSRGELNLDRSNGSSILPGRREGVMKFDFSDINSMEFFIPFKHLRYAL